MTTLPYLRIAMVGLLTALTSCTADDPAAKVNDASVAESADGPADISADRADEPDNDASTAPPCWANTLPIGGHDWNPGASLRDVAVSPDGSILLGGFFAVALEFGGQTYPGHTDDSIFIAKLNPSGTVAWLRSFVGGTDFRLAAGEDGSVALAGYYGGALDLGGGPLGGPEPEDAQSPPATRSFVALFDSNGDHAWSRSIGDDSTTRIYALDVGNDGGVTVVGYAFETAPIRPSTPSISRHARRAASSSPASSPTTRATRTRSTSATTRPTHSSRRATTTWTRTARRTSSWRSLTPMATTSGAAGTAFLLSSETTRASKSGASPPTRTAAS